MEVGRGKAIECRQGLGRAVEAAFSGEGATLVDDRDDGRPGRCAEAGAAHPLPRTLAAAEWGLVDLDAGFRIRHRKRRRAYSAGPSIGPSPDSSARPRTGYSRRPLPFQTVSETELPRSSSFSVVPPTASTWGDAAGYSAPPFAPLSPLDATNVIPSCPAGVVKWTSYAVSVGVSLNPQLIEIATTPGVFLAVSTALKRSVMLGDLASTTRMLAPGAIAWAHSTSSVSSEAHVVLVYGCPPRSRR